MRTVEATTLSDKRFHRLLPAVEFGVIAIAVAVGIFSYHVIVAGDQPQRLLTPPLVALLLVANLVPWMALLVLLGRRIARRRAVRSSLAGGGRLHVRLVALFSILASVPMLLVTIFASLLFQYGVDFWFSDRARNLFENAQMLARASYQQLRDEVDNQALAMAGDLSDAIGQAPDYGYDFQLYFARQVYFRSLSEGMIFAMSPGGQVQVDVLVNPSERAIDREIDTRMIARVNAGARSVVNIGSKRIEVVTRIPGRTDLYLYASRESGAKELVDRTQRAELVLGDYRALVERSRSLQLQFNGALLIISLLIVGLAVWVALIVADRLVRPVGELVDAAQRVADGDLTARVTEPASDDEVSTLANAFNRMTGRLQEQTSALVSANAQIERRRALIEAVLTGVTAGVVAIEADRRVRLINASAATLLGIEPEGAVGRTLDDLNPELDTMLDSGAREGVVQVNIASDQRTLAVKITRDDDGQILTFDDITQQLLDQRRAAWSDVARRIAHEIKNPLTPIQLAAERLQRRYGRKIAGEDDGTFARLTDTIVRQVGDLRRIVDEFSSFARMPKPVFRQESLVDLARQTLFLHEVAHPQVVFRLDHADPAPVLVCDRRQIGQALTNIVKNAVEAIEAKGENRDGEGTSATGTVTMRIVQDGERFVRVEVADDGIGLPVERDRIVEPYMTTRARGTGLGLAIVKKIVEEHFGTISFADNPGGGAVVAILFDTSVLSAFPDSDDSLQSEGGAEPRPSALTRIRNATS